MRLHYGSSRTRLKSPRGESGGFYGQKRKGGKSYDETEGIQKVSHENHVGTYHSQRSSLDVGSGSCDNTVPVHGSIIDMLRGVLLPVHDSKEVGIVQHDRSRGLVANYSLLTLLMMSGL